MTVQGDVSKSADVIRFVDETYRGLGGVDILINNAGVFPRSPFLELAVASGAAVRPKTMRRHDQLGPGWCEPVRRRSFMGGGQRGGSVGQKLGVRSSRKVGRLSASW